MKLISNVLALRVLRLSLCLVAMVSVTTASAHEGSLNQIPWVACEDKSLNDDCVFYNAQEDVFRGTCQSMSEVLMCVRNQPIEYAADNAQNGDDHEHDDEHSHEE